MNLNGINLNIKYLYRKTCPFNYHLTLAKTNEFSPLTKSQQVYRHVRN